MATRRDLFEIENQVPRGTLVYLAPERIEPNPRQPRQQLSRAGLEELKNSIAARGILQALLGVRGNNGRVTLIAGHRRWQAARELGLARVPIILVDNRSEGADPLLDAIIENVQRENLAPWEEGESYRQLATEFGWEHKQIAASIGKSRPYVTQRIRAAENLAPAVKEFFLTGDERILEPDNNTANVTSVTPSYNFHNNKSPEDDSNLVSFLNNVELVRRLTALTPQQQLAAVNESVALARKTGRTLALADLLDKLKQYRDRQPSPKARLKSKNGEYVQLSFDVTGLEVVRWSRASQQEETRFDEPATSNVVSVEAIEKLIARYESDLERLREWHGQHKSSMVS